MTPLTFRKLALELGFETRNHIRPSLPSLPVSMVKNKGHVKEVQDLLQARSQQIEATRPKSLASKSRAVPASDKRVKAWRFSDTGETGTDVGFTADDSYDLVSLVGESDAPRGSKDTKGVAPRSSATPSDDADADAGAMPGSQPGSLPISSEAEDEDFYMVDKGQQSPGHKMWGLQPGKPSCLAKVDRR